MLPYSEFAKVRPDVSPEEYARYQAFKYDKSGDINLFDDGQIGVPSGILKYTNEGIHGPEVQFMGRSLPATTGLLPYAFALGGGAAGLHYGGKDARIKGGMLGGLGGLALGQLAGSIIENERRRRNAAENQLENPQGLIN